MTVKDLQTSNVKSCGRDTDLATVAKLMWDGDCGAVPVINDDSRVIGMITDRDICIASATRGKTPAEMHAHDVLSDHVLYACRPDDDIRVALKTMRTHRVRRLPVLDRQQRLSGIISINDLALHATRGGNGTSVPAEEFLDTLHAICSHTRGH